MGEAVDCIGVVLGVCRELGLVSQDYTDYGRQPDPDVLLARLDQYGDRIAHPEPGAIGVFRWRADPQHVGVLAERAGRVSVIHAWERVGRCVETDLDRVWAARMLGVWRIRGVEPWHS